MVKVKKYNVFSLLYAFLHQKNSPKNTEIELSWSMGLVHPKLQTQCAAEKIATNRNRNS